MRYTITLSDPMALNGCRVEVSPDLKVLESAAKVGSPLTNAGVYTLMMLNEMRDKKDHIANMVIPRPRRIKRISLELVTVDRVEITVEDKSEDGKGGVKLVSSPSFATMAAMIAGGSKVTTVQKMALIALWRVFTASGGRDGKHAPSV